MVPLLRGVRGVLLFMLNCYAMGNSNTQNLQKIVNENNELLKALASYPMTTPLYLKPGDKVGIVSTAKRTEPHEIEQGLAVLKSWGLEPVIGSNAFNEYGLMTMILKPFSSPRVAMAHFALLTALTGQISGIILSGWLAIVILPCYTAMCITLGLRVSMR